MFRNLRGRKVVVSTPDDTFRGRVAELGLRHLVLDQFEVAAGDRWAPAEGRLRVRRRLVLTVQEL